MLEAARAASSKKAERLVVIDVSELLVITDHFLICHGNTQRQVRTIADEVERRLAEMYSVKPTRREGVTEARWIVLDYVDFVVHVFRKDDREYYDLERLWADAPVERFDDDVEGADEPAAAEAT